MIASVVCNPANKQSVLETNKILKILHQNKIEVIADKTLSEFDMKTEDVEKSKCDIVIVVGDDSTILRTFQRLSKKEIPLLGINTGDVGFLAEIEPASFARVAELLKDGTYTIEKRKRLEVSADGASAPYALNEIAIFPQASATTARYTLKIDDEFVFRDGSDGVLVSTPTGSTGYSLSAGSPIVAPSANVTIITPVNSINPSTKPIVVSEECRINIENITSSSGCEMIIDGQARIKLPSDSVQIKKAPLDAVFVRFDSGKFSKITGKLKKKIEVYEQNLSDLPPSSKFIYKTLQYEGELLTQKELIDLTNLPDRTVRYALQILLKKNLIVKRTSLRDTRQDLYSIKT